VLVGLVHFHYGPFVNECLFFGRKSVGFSEIKRCCACRYCQQTLKCGFASLTRALFMPNIRGNVSFSFSSFFHIIEFL
jgi:hypothetical protein